MLFSSRTACVVVVRNVLALCFQISLLRNCFRRETLSIPCTFVRNVMGGKLAVLSQDGFYICRRTRYVACRLHHLGVLGVSSHPETLAYSPLSLSMCPKTKSKPISTHILRSKAYASYMPFWTLPKFLVPYRGFC